MPHDNTSTVEVQVLKWPNDRMVAEVKHCWLLVQGKMTTDYYWIDAQENISCPVSREVIVMALISCLCFKDQ